MKKLYRIDNEYVVADSFKDAIRLYIDYHKNEYIYEQDIHSIEFIDDVII